MKTKMTLWIALSACLLLLMPAAGLAQDYQTEEEQQVAPESEAPEAEQTQVQEAEPAQDEQAAAQEEDPALRIGKATTAMEGMMKRNGDKIPPEVIEKAEAVAIFPGMTKAGLIVGGRYGDGVLMVNQDGNWNGPMFLSLYGASVGAQLGVESMDMVLVFLSRQGLQNLEDGKLEFGADASVTAGTYGSRADTATGADILGYQDTAGLFAGAALSTGYIEIDNETGKKYQELQGDQTRAYYSTVQELMTGTEEPKSQEVQQLADILKQYGQQAQQSGEGQDQQEMDQEEEPGIE